MSWHFSQALVAAFSGERSSGGEPSAPLSLTPTPAMCWWQGRTTDAFRPSRSGMTCEPLTADRGAELLTWCLAVSPARTSAPQAVPTAKESTANALDSGGRWPASLAKWDRASRLWRTAQLSLFGGLGECLETWPSWGWMRDGECFPLPILAHDTSVRGYGSLPAIGTPIKTQRCRSADFMRGRVPNPFEQCKAEGGKPRPEWCEWLMLWPVGWSDTMQSATAKYQEWRQWHGGF